MSISVRRSAIWVLSLSLGVASVELTARVEDFFKWGTPVLSAPDREHDLTVREEWGVRGRSNGSFKQWRLNQYGFRGPEMPLRPEPGVTRIVVLGASETFGLYESENKEYPAQLRGLLGRQGRYEVVNTAIAGLTLRGMIPLWNNWVRRFAPHVVVVYPSPGFYLANSPPAFPTRPRRLAPPPPPWWTPRLPDTLRDRFEYPRLIQRRRVAHWIAAEKALHPREWFFRSLPTERLEQYSADLDQLLAAVAATGAKLVVMTHALGFGVPLPDSDLDALNAAHAFTPRAPVSVMFEFEKRAATATLEVAARHHATTIDLARIVGGDARWFAVDRIHFNDQGAAEVASLIARAVTAD